MKPFRYLEASEASAAVAAVAASPGGHGRIEAAWIDEDDPHLNPMGTKGVGEIGIVGTAAAIANAVHMRPESASATSRSRCKRSSQSCPYDSVTTSGTATQRVTQVVANPVDHAIKAIKGRFRSVSGSR